MLPRTPWKMAWLLGVALMLFVAHLPPSDSGACALIASPGGLRFHRSARGHPPRATCLQGVTQACLVACRTPWVGAGARSQLPTLGRVGCVVLAAASSQQDPHSGLSECGERHDAVAQSGVGWASALDAKGSPLRIELANGVRPLLPTPLPDQEAAGAEADENDSQVEADEEFEYGSWSMKSPTLCELKSDTARPGQDKAPHQGQQEADADTVREMPVISNWRDGEMESALGRLEMAVAEHRVPSLVQLNRAMHLCCKAVYKGLGQAGVRQGLRVLEIMHDCGVRPNARTFDLLLDAAVGAAAQGRADALVVALTIVFNMCHLGVKPRVILINQLVKQVLKGSASGADGANADPRGDFALAVRLVDAVRLCWRRLPTRAYTCTHAPTRHTQSRTHARTHTRTHTHTHRGTHTHTLSLSVSLR